MPEDRSETTRRRGRPPKITEEQIADAVLAEGFAGLTMPAVADRLGVTTMTLYRHTATRAELLALAWDHVLDRHAWPGRNLPWRELLQRYAFTLWDLLAEHPGVVTEMSSSVLPARMAALFDDLAIELVDQGFSADDALLAVDTVIDMTLDHRRGVENLAQPVDGAAGDLRDQIRTVWESEDEPDSVRHQVRRSMRRAIATDPRVWFGRKLDLILDGVAAGHQAAKKELADSSNRSSR